MIKPKASTGANLLMIKQKTKNVPDIFGIHSLHGDFSRGHSSQTPIVMDGIR